MATLHVTGAGGARIAVSVRRGALAAIHDNQTAFSFDEAGRLVGAFVDGYTCRRNLSNDVLQKRGGSRPGLAYRQRRLLSRDEVKALEERAGDFARRLLALISAAGDASPEGLAASAILERVAGFSFDRLEGERETFQRVYGRVPIMPPDQYLALALQATEGCSFNACAFCGFYRGRRFHARSPQEFEQHVNDVAAFLGHGISLRRSIFLGDANALILPQPALLAVFDILNRRFDLRPAGAETGPASVSPVPPYPMAGIHSFIDAFTSRRKTSAEFAQLAALGLRRVYIGLESGDPELLRFLGKPNTPQDVAELARTLKTAGVGVGLVVLSGAGGARFAGAHVARTAELINSLPLDRSDVVYLSELVDYPGSDYAALAGAAGIELMPPGEVEDQMRDLRGRLRSSPGAPLVSYYDVREFIY